MTLFWPNGIGGTLGDTLATCKPLMTQQDIWYVYSGTGVDAASPAGKNREEPLATLAQAVTNSAAGDMVVLLDGHTETITGNIAINKKLVIVGEGLSGGIPTAVLTPNLAAASMLTVSVQGCQLRGIKFGPGAQANASAKVVCSAANLTVRGCYFQCGPNDTGSNLTLGAGSNSARVVNTTFISTAVALSAQPLSAIITGAIADLLLDGVVISGGSHGFSGLFAADLSAGALSRLCIESMSLLLGADMSINASSDGYCNIQNVTGGARAAW